MLKNNIIEYQDPEVFEFEIAPENNDEKQRCSYRLQLKIHSSIACGGPSIGRCTNKSLPGMTVCYIHANRDALAMCIRFQETKIRELEMEVAELKTKIQELGGRNVERITVL